MAQNMSNRDGPDAFSSEKQQRTVIAQRFWQVVDRVRARHTSEDPDRELAFITDVVEEVRQERHDANQRSSEDRG